MKSIFLFTILLCTLGNNLICFGSNTSPISINIRVIDSQKQRLPGVYLLQNSTKYLLETTNEDGECIINIENFNSKDSVQLQALGYYSVLIPISELLHDTTITLQEKQYLLTEANVKGIHPTKILKKAASYLKSHPTGHTYSIYGRGLYMKITECKNKAVELRKEYGYFFTTGNTKAKGKWDLNYKFSFVPEYTARSYNLEPNGSDTLHHIAINGSVINYDAGVQKIFTLIRATLKFGPLFFQNSSYNYHLIEYENENYVFSFQTKKDAFPSNTRIICNGTLTICQGRLKKIQFDNIEYNLILLTNLKRANPPFLTQAEISIEYDANNYPYIASCLQKTIWKHNMSNKFVAIEKPSRRNPAKNCLQEKEAFVCQTYKPITFHTNKQFENIIKYAAINPCGKYNSEIFQHLPEPIPTQKAIQELNCYMDIEQQFNDHSSKPYYPEQYILEYLHNSSDTQFLQRIQHAQKKIFNLLNDN